VLSTREQPVVQNLPAQQSQQYTVAQPQQVAAAGGAQQPPTAEQPLSEREQQRQQKIDEQITAMLANWSAAPHGASTVSETYAGYAQSVNTQKVVGTLAEVGEGGESSAPEEPVVKILPDYARLAGLLETNIDTDEDSDVIAFVPSGPYKGLKVYATGYKRINKTVDMTFNAMVWRGKTYNITAKAVDKDSLRTSLSGEVNNRYFERIILPAIAAGIGSAGQLYEQSSAQNVITPEGGIIQTYPETPNSTAVIGSVIGGAGEQAGKVLAADAALIPPKQVLIPSMTTIGIQFIGPVLSSDEIAPGAQPDSLSGGLTSSASDIQKGAAAALQ
jgi:intracellular multiplication protein IcmE